MRLIKRNHEKEVNIVKLPVPTTKNPIELFQAGVSFGVSMYALIKETLKKK